MTSSRRPYRIAPARAAGLLFALAALAAAGTARAEKLVIRGQGGFEARATRDEGELVLQGALRDDLGEPIGKETVSVDIAREGGETDATTLEALRAARSCGLESVTPSGATLQVETDPGGRFCVRVRLPRERYVAKLSWKGTGFLDAADLRVPFDLGRHALSLAFEPKPRVVSLDRTPLRLSVSAETEENGATSAAASLPLVLTEGTNETRPLATAISDAAGHAIFSLDAASFGGPRATTLVATYAGDTDTSPGKVSVPVEVHAKVTLAAPSLVAASPKNPEEGIAIDVTATTVGGPVPEGTVEARVGDLVVGAARVESGHAKLVVTFAEGGQKTLELRVRYLPQSPYYEPGADLVVELPVRGPSPLTRLPLAIAGVLVLGWLALGRRKGSAAPKAVVEKARVPTERASLELVRASTAPLGGNYTGLVEDAHEGEALGRIRVRVERRSFHGVETLIDAVTDDDGTFSFDLAARIPGDMLVVEGELHAKLEEPLPSPGELRIALVTRKRKLLERLVVWAKRAGSPYDGRAEPTPGQVKRAAEGRDPKVTAWAAAVERAAFDVAEIDERAESEVEELAPRPAEGRPVPPQMPIPGREVQKPQKLG